MLEGQRKVKITDVTLGNILVPNLSNTCYESLPTLGMPKKSDIGTKPTRHIDVIGKRTDDGTYFRPCAGKTEP